MVDIHSHLLPGMDDGPKNLDGTLKLIGLEHCNNVDTIVLTPHFRAESESISSFLQRRAHCFNLLQDGVGQLYPGIRFLLGAEVALDPVLFENSASQLCIEGTNYLLLELPWDCWPGNLPDTLYQLRLNGILPILAHVERYSPITYHPEYLRDLVMAGAVTQINSSSLCSDNRKLQKRMFTYIENNLVHLIASDAHSSAHRPPRISEAFSAVKKRFGPEIADGLIRNGASIVLNEEVLSKEPTLKSSLLKRLFGKGFGSPM